MIIAKLERFVMPENCERCDPEFAQQIHCDHWMEGQMYYFERPPMCPLMEIDETDLKNIYSAVKKYQKIHTVTVRREDVE